MPEINELAFQNADLIVLLGDPDQIGWTVPDLSRKLDRDRSNLRKTLILMQDKGLITSPTEPTLTDLGREQREAVLRARDADTGGGGSGRVGSGGPEGPTTAPQQTRRGPFDSFRPNPANRPVTEAKVRAAADTIEAVGDVVQAVETLPADANGVRMFLDGEHRWRACLLLREEGRLPAALEAGLKFEERPATETEQILIRIVTATARADLSPLDDARQLLALQQETGWSAREIAKKTGRSPADSDTGVRDVQVKIRIAKDATPEALAAYEADGSWDRLRESVAEKKVPAEPASTPLANLTRSQSLALAEAHAKAARQTDLWFDVSAGATLGAGAEVLAALGFVEFEPFGEDGPMGRVTEAGRSWLEAMDLAGPQIAAVRDKLGFPPKWGVSTWSTHWLNTVEAEEPAAVAAPEAARGDFDFTDGGSVREAPWRAEAIHALNVKTDRLQLSPFSNPDGRWFICVSTQISTGGIGEPAIASQHLPAYPSRIEAFKAARKRIMDRHPDMPPAFRDWLDQQLGPHYVNGVDRLNATNAGEARRALSWDKRHANSSGGKGKAAPASTAKPTPAPSPPPELTEAATARLHEIADWIDDNPSGNGHGFETLALGRGLNPEEDLLIAAGHLLADTEGDQAAVYLTHLGHRFVRENPTPGEAAFREANRLASETAKADPAPAEAADKAAIDALAERMHARAERHRQKGGGRWPVFPERELARQLLDAVGNGQIERAAVVIAWLSAKQGGITDRSKAVEEAGGSWLLSKQIMGAFQQLAEAARLAADPDHPAHLVQTAAKDALVRAERHLRPVKPMAPEVTT